jgi:hypothetical protein
MPIVELLEDRTLLDAGPGLPSALAEQFVTALYRDVRHRTPAPAEVGGWVNALRSGLSREQAAAGFLAGPEYRANLIRDAYHQLLGREPEAAGSAAWTSLLGAGLPPNNSALSSLPRRRTWTGAGWTRPPGWPGSTTTSWQEARTPPVRLSGRGGWAPDCPGTRWLCG